MLLGFWQPGIIPTTERNLCLGYSRTIKKFNDTRHTSFVKHDIYQKIHYVQSQAIYLLPTHLARDFEILGELITCLIYAADTKFRRKITGSVKWSPDYNKAMDLVELWVLLKARYYKHCYRVWQITQIQRKI